MFDFENTLKLSGLSATEGLRADVAGLVSRYHPATIDSAPEAAIALRILAGYLNTLADRVDQAEEIGRARIGAGYVAIRNRRIDAQARAVQMEKDPVAPRTATLEAWQQAEHLATIEDQARAEGPWQVETAGVLEGGKRTEYQARDTSNGAELFGGEAEHQEAEPSPRDIAELAGPVCCRCGVDESTAPRGNYFASTDSGADVCAACYNAGDCEPEEGENFKVKISDLCAIPESLKRDRTLPKATAPASPAPPGQARKAKQPKPSKAPATPNAEQLRAVVDFASAHMGTGQTWKEDLLQAWRTGTDDSFRDCGHLLRQVRNNFGPKWLSTFKLPGGGSPAKLSAPPKTGPEGPRGAGADISGLSMIDQARALSNA